MADQEVVIEENVRKERLDAYLAKSLENDHSRSQIKLMIKSGEIKVNGHDVAPHYQVKPGDRIQIKWIAQPDDSMRAEEIPIDILYEDEDIIVVNKPVGMVVHPAHGNWHHTLVNALLHHTRHLSELGGDERPGIVHRLDKDTSGVLIVAKNNAAHRDLAKQFKKHTIQRMYYAIVRGVVQHDEGVCEEPVGRAFVNRKKIIIKPSGGKDALTYYKAARRYTDATLVEVYPKTGRTHQIRVHMSFLGHPVLGDTLYGIKSELIGRQALHAAKLGITHPKTKQEMLFESPLPADMQAVLDRLESGGDE
ncbi:MAG: RluA family pseudouridine synthase [Candidatus Omnitrophica bacterium]|nr:RluA family pseudouridine synthase [Candidatus Omnitrophota bacterium]